MKTRIAHPREGSYNDPPHIMKMLVDLLPVVIFFVTYKFRGIFEATAAAIAVALVQTLWSWFKHRKLEQVQVITLGMLVFFGGATLIFRDPVFIKWKPTVVQWFLAGLFWASSFMGRGVPVIRKMFGEHLTMPDEKWRQLNLAWVAFFMASGILNLMVAYSFDEDTWVNFKLFGLTGLTLIFAMAQAYWLSDHIQDKETPPQDPA